MSLTIKLSKKGNTNPTAEPSTVRRKSNRRRVTTDSEEDDYEPSPPRTENKQKRKPAPKAKGHVEKEDLSIQDEQKPTSTRPRDRNQSGGLKRPRDDALSADEPEGEVDVAAAPDEESSAIATAPAVVPDAVKEESSSISLPPFKKKRLPPIKKNKPGAVPSSSGASNQPATGKSGPKPLEAKGGPTFAQEDTVGPLSVLKRPKRLNNAQEVNLNDRSVYESLFKHVRPLSSGLHFGASCNF
ncbi:hypothetical protein BGW80DRAFT_1269504 [Lactifluus volemus]|nr:hypothetical protein BGW80DRAFT_1269504 [Lactifluus volemus]